MTKIDALWYIAGFINTVGPATLAALVALRTQDLLWGAIAGSALAIVIAHTINTYLVPGEEDDDS
jgi:hypothetical protein